MTAEINLERRRLFGMAALTVAAVELGLVSPASAVTSKAGNVTIPATPAAAHTQFETLKSVKAGDLEIGYAESGPRDGPVALLLVPHLRGYGTTRFLSASTPRNGQQSALAADMIALMDALGIDSAIIAGYDWGARTACIMAALWPERCRALVSVSGYLIGSQVINAKPLPPKAELAWWYQFYFATERGRLGYAANTREFARLIWQTASPTWKFDDATFERSARSLDNPDHVAVTIHNYRWRLGIEDGETRFDAYEDKLAKGPRISVPTITMEGDANGAPHPEPSAYAAKFSGKYQHRTISGGIGHNLPQEAPREFAQAVLDVARL
jgi:pimeloyl-ACP methyl ester carboxylesterase